MKDFGYFIVVEQVTSSGPSSKSFRKNIQYGTKEYGAVKFVRGYNND